VIDNAWVGGVISTLKLSGESIRILARAYIALGGPPWWQSMPMARAWGLPDSKVGTFTRALYDEAQAEDWTVISMKNDWKHIFVFEK
jgi:hypothetical protein